MIRVAIDSNILIYAEFEPESEKRTRSTDLIERAAQDGVIIWAMRGEFLRFAQPRVPAAFDDAIRASSALPGRVPDSVDDRHRYQQSVRVRDHRRIDLEPAAQRPWSISTASAYGCATAVAKAAPRNPLLVPEND